MFERRTLMMGGAALIAGAALPLSTAAQNRKMAGMDISMAKCIDLCVASHRMCLETATHMLKRAGSSAATALVAMLTDCAELCQATANSMLRGSELHAILCGACADACDRCAQECARQGADEQLARCSATCRECGAACRKMAMMDQ